MDPGSKSPIENTIKRFAVIAGICIIAIQLFSIYLPDWNVLRIIVGLVAGVVCTAVIRDTSREQLKQKAVFWVLGMWVMAVTVVADYYASSFTYLVVFKILIGVILIAAGSVLVGWLNIRWSKQGADSK